VLCDVSHVCVTSDMQWQPTHHIFSRFQGELLACYVDVYGFEFSEVFALHLQYFPICLKKYVLQFGFLLAHCVMSVCESRDVGLWVLLAEKSYNFLPISWLQRHLSLYALRYVNLHLCGHHMIVMLLVVYENWITSFYQDFKHHFQIFTLQKISNNKTLGDLFSIK